ncbi:MAG: AAA family ATPase [Clostridia bacterium]|nr:AAA family ATPase [Clostridia bacterium]
MVIDRITIGHFGGVKEFDCSFSEGINLIEGRNEAGKTTISTFIKFIFYGLSGKAKSGGLSERRKYQSWETDSADGSLEFTHKGTRYRIERSLIPSAKAQGKETVKIIDLATNTECLQGVNPGKYFFGVTEDVFLQTAFVGQADGSVVDGGSVAVAIENMLFAGDEMISTKAAQKKLEEGRTMLLYKNKKGGKIYELQNETEKLSRSFEKARVDHGTIISREAERAELQAKLDSGKQEAEHLSEKMARADAIHGMEGFTHLAALEDQLSARKEAYENYCNENSYDGFLPDAPYSNALKESYRDIGFREGQLAQEQQRKLTLGGDRMDAADRELLARSAEDGGAEGIADLLETNRHKSRTSRIFGGFFLVMTVIWAAVASACVFVPAIADTELISNISMKTLGYGLYGVAALLAILGVIFLARGSSISRGIRRLLERYGVPTEQELYEHINTAARRREAQRLYEQKRNDIDETIKGISAELNARRQDAIALLARIGKEYQSKDDLTVAANECDSMIAHRNDLYNEVGKAEASVEAVRRTLEGEDKEKLAEIIARTEWAGEINDADLEEIRASHARRVAENETLADAIHQLDLELARLGATVENPATLADTIYEKTALLSKLQIEHDALRLACDSIDAATENLRSSVAPKLSMQASTLMRKGTNGKYETIGVNNQLEMQYGASSGVGYTTRDIDFMSSGTRDLAYISLRMSLIGLLYHKTNPPLFFDESFARLDDDRLTAMCGLLREYAGEGSQIFLFTSQHRDAQILAKQGEYRHIQL